MNVRKSTIVYSLNLIAFFRDADVNAGNAEAQ